MSFNSKNFSVMAYANGFTLWNYTTPDALTDVNTAGYYRRYGFDCCGSGECGKPGHSRRDIHC